MSRPLQFVILAERIDKGAAARSYPDCATLKDLWAWASENGASKFTVQPDLDPTSWEETDE